MTDVTRKNVLRLGLASLATVASVPAWAGAKTATRLPSDDDAYAAFTPYYGIGGVLQFSIYTGAQGTDAEARTAISDTLAQAGRVDHRELANLTARSISDAQFFGDWYDPADSKLIRRGRFTTTDGQILNDPKLAALNGVEIAGIGSTYPEPGGGGQFAFAFLEPPYGLRATPDRIQQVFDGVRATLLPAGMDSRILDWTSRDLPKVSHYFDDGMEWWGVFLFTVYCPDRQRLIVITGSTTD